MKNFIKGVTKRKEFKIVSALVTIGLTLFDMGSDLLLAVNYASTGKDDWWFGLTLTFFLIPVLLLLLIIVGTGRDRDMEGFKELFPYWKQFECTAESGPQLILQLYIMSLPTILPTGHETPESSTVIDLNATFPNLPEVTSVTQNINATGMYENRTTSTDQQGDKNHIEELVTLVLQIFVLVTALLSISWGYVSLKINSELRDGGPFSRDNYWGPVDYICDMAWNVLCISSRVIALALFASRERFWFIGLVISHFLIAAVIYISLTRGLVNYEEDPIMVALVSISLAVTSVFNGRLVELLICW